MVQEIEMVLVKVPNPRMIDGVRNYLEKGRAPGDFLLAVITNDLKRACERADLHNQHLLYDWVFFFYNYAPLECWGNAEKVDAWMRDGGYIGRHGEDDD